MTFAAAFDVLVRVGLGLMVTWVVVWGSACALLARARGSSVLLAAALGIVLGPVGLLCAGWFLPASTSDGRRSLRLTIADDSPPLDGGPVITSGADINRPAAPAPWTCAAVAATGGLVLSSFLPWIDAAVAGRAVEVTGLDLPFITLPLVAMAGVVAGGALLGRRRRGWSVAVAAAGWAVFGGTLLCLLFVEFAARAVPAVVRAGDFASVHAGTGLVASCASAGVLAFSVSAIALSTRTVRMAELPAPPLLAASAQSDVPW